MLEGDAVRQIGECCGPLVCRNDKVRIIAVIADRVSWWHHLSVHQIVGQVQHARNKLAIGGLALGQPSVTIDGWIRQRPSEKSTLCAHGHDDSVFDLLRLNQAQDLGAEVLLPITPTQSASGHRSETQVHSFYARRVHPNFVLRPRQWYLG